MVNTLLDDLQHAGYYPELVARVLDLAIAGEKVTAHLVHPETIFESDQLLRHLTAVVLTPTRLVRVHVDEATAGHALATTEAVRLDRISSVALTHGIRDPEVQEHTEVEELIIAVSWSGATRVDLEPATCDDPQCQLDHGYTGFMQSDDLVLRVSAQADGPDHVNQALQFAAALSKATTRL